MPSGVTPLCEPAPAKVNLFLHVLGRRGDGYHLLDSLAVFAGAGDVLRAEPADDLSLDLRGPFSDGLQAEPDNLVLRAARALAEAAGVPARARLMLDKRLPVASGIGGGSADAAAALRLLARLWRIDPAAIAAVAPGLGADVPACVASRPVRMGGVGERLGAAPGLPAFGLLLVNPGVPVATPAVFRARTGPFSAEATLPPAWKGAAAMAADLAALSNDLQAPAAALCPAVEDALGWLRSQPGCLLARMSGSGATCFGVFAGAAEASASAAGAPAAWWSWGGGLHAG